MMKSLNPEQIVEAKTTEQKFSLKSVAKLIGVHVSTVSRLMDSCKLGYYQIGKRRIAGQGESVLVFPPNAST
jgi:type IV secretory pathway protease TraF